MMVRMLEREVYSIAEAARLLVMPHGTLTYWLEGTKRSGKHYLPVLRETPTGNRNLTWGEFVEAGLLRQYRSNQIPMAELRAFITNLRDDLGVPYPLAHAKPFIGGKELLWRAQERAGLPPSEALVSEARGQYLLLPAADAYLRRVDFAERETAQRWRLLPEDSDVVLDPQHRFGAPTIGGIRTLTLWEAVQDTGDVEGTAQLFGLKSAQVHEALAYEELQRSKAA